MVVLGGLSAQGSECNLSEKNDGSNEINRIKKPNVLDMLIYKSDEQRWNKSITRSSVHDDEHTPYRSWDNVNNFSHAVMHA